MFNNPRTPTTCPRRKSVQQLEEEDDLKNLRLDFRAVAGLWCCVIAPGALSVEGPWIPGRPALVVVRWQHTGTLDFGVGVERVELPARSGEHTSQVVCGPFQLAIKLSSTPAGGA